MTKGIVLSLFDHSGEWSRPYTEAGYDVRRVCLPWDDVRTYEYPMRAHGILAAPPCTEFAVSGARWWASKHPDLLDDALELVDVTLSLVSLLRPKWWAVENPVGRLRRLRPALGAPRLQFDPCDYAAFARDPEAERYTKRTQLFGVFNALSRAALTPVLGSKMHRMSSTWKTQRAVTPSGFAHAFFEANP